MLHEAQEAPRLLLVEDDASNRLTMAALLEDDGFVVDTAASQAEAKALLCAGGSYGAVLLDGHLGDGCGLDLLPLIRTRLPQAGTLLVSGSGVVSDETDAAFLKGDDYGRLVQLVWQVLKRDPP